MAPRRRCIRFGVAEFAKVLERAIGWEGYHLHLFDVGGVLFAIPGEDADYPIDEEHQHLVS